ncbi:ISAzo13 family transposase [PVC group bacterium]|nr:ISAzo13 family transposase [PVC group bacterium]
MDRITELMKHETAGDPMSGLKWIRKTTEKIASELRTLGITVGPKTVARLLKQMGYSLRVNHKKLSRVSKTAPEDRNAQFEHIAELREGFAARGLPVISVDTKKKELVGRFKNPGVAWNSEPVPVNDHDFPSDAEGKAVPYGIYDIQANRGTVFVGTSRDTAEFAVDSIEKWWLSEGRRRYPGARQLAILADGGGSNSSTNRAWKHRLCHELAQRHGLTVTVAHYPPGASKWNPIEHRLFSQISKNWAGRPLDSWETVLNYIRTTTTTTGLKVEAYLLDRNYEKGLKITDAQMRALPITWHDSLPRWNYTLAANAA